MIALLQRVKKASVTVEQQVVGQIGPGLLILLGVETTDTIHEVTLLSKKAAQLRIFRDEEGRMNNSVIDEKGSVLVVSQFTLPADCRKGRRPSFNRAARPEQAIPLYQRFCDSLVGFGLEVATGSFGAMMDVALVNDGPVTIILDSHALNARKT